MADLTNILGGPWEPPAAPPAPRPPEDQLRSAMVSAGIEPPDQIVMDGKIHRFPTNGKRGDEAGWYVIYPDGVPAGAFGCWRDGVTANFRADMGRELSAAEQMESARRQREARDKRQRDQELRQQATVGAVEAIWRSGMEASAEHPYIKRKGLSSAHGARITPDGRLMLPLYDEHGELSSLQYITEDGGKQYQSGGKAGGCSWLIGNQPDAGEALYIAEGFATAATVHEVTGDPVAVAYSAGNLPKVTGQWRERLGAAAQMVIVADNDASGVGRMHADQAAAKHGARVVMPPVEGDANDYHLSGADLSALLSPSDQGWLVPADDFCAQPAPIAWHVKRWIQRDALIMVHGPSGGGKTFVVLDWCLTLASGTRQWFGQSARPCPVVYLAGEGHHGLRGRIAAWKQERGAGKLDMWLSKEGCDLNTPAGYQRVVEAITTAGVKPGVIVVDTLHRFLQGDENSAQDAKTMLDACNALQQHFGCTVILVHHTGVSDEAQHRARGSSAWRGALDIEISVVPGKDDRPMEIIQRKSKDAELAPPVYCDLVSVPIMGWTDEDGDQVSSAVIEQTDAPQHKAKGESKHAKHIKMVEAAWWRSGAELVDGKPYLSRSAMIEYLMADLELKESSAKVYIKPSSAGKPISDLLIGGVIEATEHGWVVVDKVLGSAWAMAKK